jgi:5-methylthioadenosine/S-adenosylhomocysteine deaminase
VRLSSNLGWQNRSSLVQPLDFYFYQNDLAKLVKEAGIRAVMCEGVIDFPRPDFQTPNETFVFVETFLQNWKDDEFVTPCIGPHAPYTTSPWIYQRAAELVDEYGGLLTTHLSESPTENQTIQERYGVSPTEYLSMNDFLTPQTILAHSVWLSDNDRKLIHNGGSHLAHHPSSNLKLASGLFDLMAAKDAGKVLCSYGFSYTFFNDIS